MLDLVIYGKAEPAGSKRWVPLKNSKRVRIIDANPKAADWKRWVADEAALAWKGQPLLTDIALSFHLIFYRPRPKSHYRTGKRAGELKEFHDEDMGDESALRRVYPTTRPDLLKLARAIEDALTGIVYRDDALICAETLRKFYGEPMRVEIHLDILR